MKLKKGIILILVAFMLPISAWAQFNFEPDYTVQVSENGRTFKTAWAGGLNNPQYGSVDLNQDGDDDLVVLDRGFYDNNQQQYGHRLLTFLYDGTVGSPSYSYAPQYENWFPPVRLYMVLVDMNCDGVVDLITAKPPDVDYYEGRWEAGELKFDSVGIFNQITQASGLLNIDVLADDIPALADFNGDGDMDMLSFNTINGFNIYLFENQSMELTGTCGDSIVFKLVDDCWGLISENGLSQAVSFLPGPCGDVGPHSLKTGSTRHAGSTIMAYDEDGDNDMDLLLGDVSYSNMTRLLNHGTKDSAIVLSQDTTFPSYDVSIDMDLFPAGFHLDVDNDGRKDLLVAPNGPRTGENLNSTVYYKNISTDDTVRFQFSADSFLVRDMVDLGEGAYPAFFDYNADGLIDLVVGNFGYYRNVTSYKPGLALFKNVGTNTQPAFELINRDYLGLSAYTVNGSSVRAIAPAFADMDGDGDLDMLFGEKEGFLHLYINTAGVGNPANLVFNQQKYGNIDVGQYSRPLVYDVNGDQAQDLIVGELFGTLNYFENTGTATSPTFNTLPTNGFFGEVNVTGTVPDRVTGYTAPLITTLDDSNVRYLLSGNEDGKIVVYRFNQDSIYEGSFAKVFDSYANIDVGEQSNFTMADIDQDNRLEMVVGNYRGGLTYYEQTNEIFTSVEDIEREENGRVVEIKIYPNPTSDFFTMQWVIQGANKDYDLRVEMFNLLGEQVDLMQQKRMMSKGSIQMDTQHQKPGIYIIVITINGEQTVAKLIKQ